uniref:AIG1-type G domain-containing protein n=1 Tax=Panagrolaimus superbus TaxID=310955 RepID=A0A914Z3F4_9BILA
MVEKNTTTPKLYTVAIGDTVYNLLDTPGFTEKYGKPKNYEIFKEIEAAFLQHLPEIHGICFVIKASKEEVPNFIEKIIKNTLTLFPKKAVSNCFFIFTHANQTHFTSGTGSAKIKQIISNFEQTYDARIRYSVENICILDNLGMRWLIAIKNRLSCPPLKEVELKACWNESKKQLEKIMATVAELPGITKDEILQCRMLTEIGIMLQAEIISTSEANTLQHVLNDGIYKIVIISKWNNSEGHHHLRSNSPPITMSKLIEGLSLIKRAVKNEELKQKIDQINQLHVLEVIPTVVPERVPTPIEDPIPPEPILPIIIPQKPLRPETIHHPQQPHIARPETIPQVSPHFKIPPPPPTSPPETPQIDYFDRPSEEDNNDDDDDEIQEAQKPSMPESRQLELLEDIADGIKDNCEQGDLTNIYESELKSIQKAVSATSFDHIDFKDLIQALRVFEHNPKIGHKTKTNIKEYLNGLNQ